MDINGNTKQLKALYNEYKNTYDIFLIIKNTGGYKWKNQYIMFIVPTLDDIIDYQTTLYRVTYKSDIDTYLHIVDIRDLFDNIRIIPNIETDNKLVNKIYRTYLDMLISAINNEDEDKCNYVIKALIGDKLDSKSNNNITLSKYDNIWFTSDLHFGHKNIINYEERDKYLNISPDIKEHDEKLIYNYNTTVSDNDLVFILGDISFYNSVETNKIIDRLRGDKILVYGNHDEKYVNSKLIDKSLFKTITPYLEIKYNDINICLMHYPILSFNGMYNDKSIHLFGHIHSVSTYQYPKHSYHIGVDVNDYKPVNIDTAIQLALSNNGGIYNERNVK